VFLSVCFIVVIYCTLGFAGLASLPGDFYAVFVFSLGFNLDFIARDVWLNMFTWAKELGFEVTPPPHRAELGYISFG